MPETDRKDLEAGLKRLGESIEKLRGIFWAIDFNCSPDVQIFHEAVRVALQYNEFFKPEEIYRAKDLLRQGQGRADALSLGQAPWTTRQVWLFVVMSRRSTGEFNRMAW